MSTPGDMLRLARQRRGFTQKAVAERLGVTQPVLSRFENGIADPDDAFLEKASLFFDLPRAFFSLREPVYGPPVSVHPMPRAKAEVTARDMDMVTAELNLRVMQLRKLLEAVDFAPSSDLPLMDIDDYGSAEKISSVLRAHWGLPTGMVKNVTSLMERAGVVIGVSDFDGASVSGMTFRVPGVPPMVLINGRHPADRMRFTLAHELGHLVMHRMPSPNMEDEANAFAAAFLLPEREFKASLLGRKISLKTLGDLKTEWKVSMQALLMRMKALGLVDTNQSRYLWQQLSSKGWRLREPPEFDFAHEQPMILNRIISTHLKQLGYSFEDLCNLVPMHGGEFTKMYSIPEEETPTRPRFRIVS